MFDNLNLKNNNQPNAPKQSLNNPVQPSNPTPDNQNKQDRFSQPKPLATQKQVEDIFSKTDEVDRAGEKKPKIFQSKEPKNIISANKNSANSPSKQKIIIFIIIAIGLIIVVMASFWAINKFFNNSQPIELDNKPIINQEPGDDQKNEEKNNENNQDEEKNNENNINSDLDSDQDGLSDAEEKKIGTDSNNVDSDDDGLFDREEVEIYETDPLDADSDNDGFLDGEEVREGNNPNGSGRLYEIPGLDPGASPISGSQTLDSDQDGLLDIEENEYGTDVLKVDTDNDKLSDYQEIKIYKTNPLVADTDEDGYMDGEEVKNGYNPLGEGKL